MQRRAPPTVVRKTVLLGPGLATRSTNTSDIEFDVVASDESVDRMGDIIRVDGWQLGNFQRNAIALRQHNHDWPVGTVPRLWTAASRLMARIALAAEGTSEIVDETRRLVQQGVLRAVSVGFMPLEWKFLEDGNGFEFIEHELLELSVVSVPANANATFTASVARAYGVDHELLIRTLGETPPRVDASGVLAARKRLVALS